MKSWLETFWNKHWKWILGILSTILFGALFINAKSWVHETTETYLKTEAADKQVSAILGRLYESSIVASYQSHFVLSSAKNDHYIPIYVTDTRDVRLFLDGAHHGAGERVKFDIFINGTKLDDGKINYDFTEQQAFSRVFYLKKAIADYKENVTSYEANRDIVTIGFRVKPSNTKTANAVHIKALINVIGAPMQASQ